MAFVVTIARARMLYVALALSAALLPVTTELTCYYYVFFLVAVGLTRCRPELEAVLLVVAGVSPFAAAAFNPLVPTEARYVGESVLFVSLGVALLAATMPPKWPKWPKSSSSASP